MSTAFIELLHTLLRRTQLADMYITQILAPHNIPIFQAAFTTSEISDDNYEWYEQVGDALLSAFFIDYIYTRFPQLRNQTGIRVVSRLRTNHVSRKSLAALATKCGFLPHIIATPNTLARNSERLLEDVFEAFFGALKIVVDGIQPYFGFMVVTKLLKSIFDEEIIDIVYANLVDPKTQLKEFIDANPSIKITYANVSSRSQTQPGTIQHESNISVNDVCVATTYAKKMKEAEQEAAQITLAYLKEHYPAGFTRWGKD